MFIVTCVATVVHRYYFMTYSKILSLDVNLIMLITIEKVHSNMG